MSSLEFDEELARLTIPELVALVTKMTSEYAAALERVNCEILVRIMQQAE